MIQVLRSPQSDPKHWHLACTSKEVGVQNTGKEIRIVFPFRNNNGHTRIMVVFKKEDIL